MKSHTLVDDYAYKLIRYQLRPARDNARREVTGLFNAWIALDNPSQLNSYTTDTVKELILAFRQASMGPERGGGRVHGHGRQGVLHRRQHQGVRRVLRR